MSTVTTLAEAVVDAIRAALPEIDAWSTAGFEPAVSTEKTALIATVLGQIDELRASSFDTGIETVHRLRIHLWTKIVQGEIETGIDRARDAGHRALRAVVAADGTTYQLVSDEPLTARTDDTLLVVGDIPFVRTILTIPVWQVEEV